jgi:SAM-dependent methyltransferase
VRLLRSKRDEQRERLSQEDAKQNGLTRFRTGASSVSHLAQRAFVDIVARNLPSRFEHSKVLEIGSLDINGSVRQFFRNCDYVGIDVAPGKGVDVVCQAQDYAAPSDSFDHVISCESMEHNPHWARTFANMVRLCRPGGLVVMTCATVGRPEHGTVRTSRNKSPLTVELGWDYYRNLAPSDFRKIVDMESTFSHHCFATNWSSFDLYFCGIKRAAQSAPVPEWDALMKVLQAYVLEQNQRKICIYRSIAAPWLGDRWFALMRRLSAKFGFKTLAYMHE